MFIGKWYPKPLATMTESLTSTSGIPSAILWQSGLECLTISSGISTRTPDGITGKYIRNANQISVEAGGVFVDIPSGILPDTVCCVACNIHWKPEAISVPKFYRGFPHPVSESL
tara:strand:- start:338 stop:679 length:342 start_codon:yes stop_codon:yes gene_type:complete